MTLEYNFEIHNIMRGILNYSRFMQLKTDDTGIERYLTLFTVG